MGNCFGFLPFRMPFNFHRKVEQSLFITNRSFCGLEEKTHRWFEDEDMFDWSSLVPNDQGGARMADSNYFSLAESMSALEDPFEEYCEIVGGGDLIRKSQNSQRSPFGMGSVLLARFKNIKQANKATPRTPDSALNSESDLEWEPEQMANLKAALNNVGSETVEDYDDDNRDEMSTSTCHNEDGRPSRSPPLEWDSDDLLDCDTLELLNSIDTMAPCINASKLYPS
ncbi:hypothetical protein T10_3197 [Trichinella papuae]|uniref:Uncharacterized protein n=1 Tax=Trichinella papuae TaxID=268474 RepID=A0A0V1MJL2_9BILA|nr:hypothetical protein T10_3197 [Trichinella papuae]